MMFLALVLRPECNRDGPAAANYPHSLPSQSTSEALRGTRTEKHKKWHTRPNMIAFRAGRVQVLGGIGGIGDGMGLQKTGSGPAANQVSLSQSDVPRDPEVRGFVRGNESKVRTTDAQRDRAGSPQPSRFPTATVCPSRWPHPNERAARSRGTRVRAREWVSPTWSVDFQVLRHTPGALFSRATRVS